MHAVLRRFGHVRNTSEHDAQLVLQPPNDLAAMTDKRFDVGAFRLGNAEIDELMRSAYFSEVDGIEPATPRRKSDMQLVVLVGRVHIVYPHDLVPLPVPPTTAPHVLSFSVPGVNVEYNAVDMSRYELLPKTDTRHVVQHRLIVRYKVIFAHVFACMQREHIAVPVLCAIGCGAFAKNYESPDVSACVARAAATVLCENQQDYTSFKCVIFCLPSRTDRNFPVFVPVFRVRTLFPSVFCRRWPRCSGSRCCWSRTAACCPWPCTCETKATAWAS